VIGFLAALQVHRITQAVVVPPIVHALARHPAVDQYDLSSLQWLGCGAAPLGAELQLACAQRIGCPVGQGYGMTEATAGIALWRAGTPVVPGSSGQLLPGVRARIVDPDTGSDRNRGETGELWVRTPSVITGYLGSPYHPAQKQRLASRPGNRVWDAAGLPGLAARGRPGPVRCSPSGLLFGGRCAGGDQGRVLRR
jgi:acyl-coenzyme A synthetase/AMP-(fatty) acid ligase